MTSYVKKTFFLFLSSIFFIGGFAKGQRAVGQEKSSRVRTVQNPSLPKQFIISRAQLEDKIKGGWAGQTIGVTFGGPYEFRFPGSFIQDYQPLLWYDGYMKKTMLEEPGLYDDLYMDLSFVEVFEKYGLDAPVDFFASAFANAGFTLWHANQTGRYNILNGLKAPASGHWLNNPHADDIDYQIESDYAGLMSPGMPNTASAISDKIGHIMNYGDGWYGGVFVGALYSLSFVSGDIPFLVGEALKTIPVRSTYHECISDVIRWHRQFPDDWHRTWFEMQKKWSSDIGCPDGVFNVFDIDAKLNSAYVVMGLLYGKGDFTKSLEVATRAGQDADCNPSTVGGILGTILGYNRIPAYWKQGLKEAEDIDFKYTSTSLKKVYRIGMKHALLNIARHGGLVSGDPIVIQVEAPAAVRVEESFSGIYPADKVKFEHKDLKEESFDFEGTGIVIKGGAFKKNKEGREGVCEATLFIDGRQVQTGRLPTDYTIRKDALFWAYGLSGGKHHLTIRATDPQEEYAIWSSEYIVYRDRR